MTDILGRFASLTPMDENEMRDAIVAALRGFGIPEQFMSMAVNSVMNNAVRPREAALIALVQEAAREIERLRSITRECQVKDSMMIGEKHRSQHDD